MSRRGYRKCQRCERNRAEKFYTGKRGRICASCKRKSRSKAGHEQRVMATYGLRSGEYDALFKAQDGRCAICRETRSQRLSVDHCHKSGVVRGLLCRRCNGRLLTAALDRPWVLRAAADYLEDPPAVRHLGERLYQHGGA
ncbi:endonuclease domain-containing protein [Spirillospora sp. NPDC127200]